MDETTLRSRQQKTTTDQNQNQNRNSEDKEKMFVKNRKPSTDYFALTDEQKLPTNIRDLFDQRLLQIFVWEFYFGYLFWSIFFGIGPMVMFFPMVKLAIDGYEVLVLSLASPIILGSSLINQFAESTVGKLLTRLVIVICLLSFQIENPVLRLFVLAIGTCAMMIDFCTSLNCRYHAYRSIVIWTLILSFFFFLSLRVCYRSIMPAWSTNTTNFVHFVLGLAVIVHQFLLDKTMWQMLPSFNLSMAAASGTMPGINPLRTIPKENLLQPNWILVGVGFGSVLFILQWVFGDLSVISRWASTGFPDQAPDPIPYGLLVWICLFVGVLLVHRPSIVTNRWWASVGFIGYALLYFARGNLSFAGGLALSVFIGSILPLIFDKIARGLCIRITVIAAYTYILQVVYAVWTSAYNFVPFGGTLTRETSHILLFFNFLGIYFGVYTAKYNLGTYIRARVTKVQFPNVKLWSTFGVVFLLACAGTWSRWMNLPSTSSMTKSADSKYFSAAIWTVHFGYDNNARPSLDRAAALLGDLQADVIGLLETDTAKPFFGNNDLTSYLAEKLHMYADFGPSTKDHTWGCIILSKYPIVRSVHYLLPSPEGELAPAILATVQTPASLVDVVIVHMGNDRDDLDRRLQAEKLRDIMRNSTNPLVFLGYVTSAPMSRDYRVLTSVAKDIDPTDRDRWCEYILYKNLIRVGYARITHGGLTDTEVQMGKFRVPTSTDNTDHPVVITDPSRVKDSSILFNPKFGSFHRGHGYFNTHRFHMDTPKYFLPSEPQNN